MSADGPATEVARRRAASLRRIERFSRLMDSSVRIPFTRVTFGLDGLLGLVPVVGDVTGFLLSGYVLLESQRAGASKRVKAHMIKNILLDATVGSVPILGDVFDVMYKANMRNARLLRRELEADGDVRGETERP
ncbi:DUF4112 domain-containing protein [Marinobacter lacisalsi]|uniref:DUF4112 domain-containing protein n=1 Tax=Marinobacter lacisalsi TaxID=475979 RepID=A0ABV8QCY3_9GAMM